MTSRGTWKLLPSPAFCVSVSTSLPEAPHRIPPPRTELCEDVVTEVSQPLLFLESSSRAAGSRDSLDRRGDSLGSASGRPCLGGGGAGRAGLRRRGRHPPGLQRLWVTPERSQPPGPTRGPEVESEGAGGPSLFLKIFGAGELDSGLSMLSTVEPHPHHLYLTNVSIMGHLLHVFFFKPCKINY
jgi:hypothetical protein